MVMIPLRILEEKTIERVDVSLNIFARLECQVVQYSSRIRGKMHDTR